jgi:hypothetical protein
MGVKVRVMVDIRDREATVAAIREAQQQFEKDAPPPAAAVELLGQLHEQLGDSGPFEFEGPSEAIPAFRANRWGSALEISGKALERAESDSSPRAARRVRSSLAALEVFFENGPRWRWTWRSTPKVAIVILAPVLLPLLAVVLLFGWPYEELQRRRSGVLRDPHSAAVELELRDRLLFAKTTVDRRRLIVATDRGIVIAKPEDTRVRIECEIPYPKVRAKRTGEKGKHLAIRATDSSEKYTMFFNRYELPKILQLRAPDAFRADPGADEKEMAVEAHNKEMAVEAQRERWRARGARLGALLRRRP